MPGTLEKVMPAKEAEGRWDWDQVAYQHPMMAPLRQWKGNTAIDFIRNPRSVSRYWEVKPAKGQALVLAAYAKEGHPPALLERVLDAKAGPGRVLLFTTPLDLREPLWNNYQQGLEVSFYLMLVHRSMLYVAGDTESVRLNFLGGQTVPTVRLPLAPRYNSYTLWRDAELIDTVSAERTQNELRFPQAVAPGNYAVEGERERIAFFSVNAPPEESNLTRVPVEEVEGLFGTRAVVPLDVQSDLREALSGHWGEPTDLFWLLANLLLVVLLAEILLANLFYRREPASDDKMTEKGSPTR
jgi:hypothetical protein